MTFDPVVFCILFFASIIPPVGIHLYSQHFRNGPATHKKEDLPEEQFKPALPKPSPAFKVKHEDPIFQWTYDSAIASLKESFGINKLPTIQDCKDWWNAPSSDFTYIKYCLLQETKVFNNPRFFPLFSIVQNHISL